MAKKAYIGVDNVARKIGKGYIGIEGVARKIRKAYIGIGGVARPCFGGGELVYYGTITPLSYSCYGLAATTIGDYAIFGGGNRYNEYNNLANYSRWVYAYDDLLTKTTIADLIDAAGALAATTIGDYALFGGGQGYDAGQYPTVRAYNKSLTMTTATELSRGRSHLAATTVGDYAIFGGGYDYGSYCSTVDAYDKSLTRTIPTTLSVSRSHLAATTVGDHALFGGGTGDRYNGGISATLDAYDKSLTRTIPTTLSVSRSHLAATTVGDHALFGGGANSSSDEKPYSARVDAYNKFLTRTVATDLSSERFELAATTIGDYALFGGGRIFLEAPDLKSYSTVDVYNKFLTRTVATDLSSERYGLAATTVGDYALFGGGHYVGSYDVSTTVDAYVYTT